MRSVVKEIVGQYRRILRFLAAGGCAAATNLSVLYITTEFFGVWYIISSIIAFVCSLVVSFTLQKFWTFKDNSIDILHKQLVKYVCVTVTNLCINTLLLYALVEYMHLHYLIAQVIVMGVIAIESYIIYQRFIFSR